MMIYVRRDIRIIIFCTDFYKIMTDDPVTAKMVFSGLQKLKTSTVNDMEGVVETLETHLYTQLVKVITALKIRNTGKKHGSDRDGASDVHLSPHK